MREIRRFAELGTANYGWLDAHYHFSFAGYHDPARMGFGVLRVINDDRIAPGNGFDPHPHRDMEIITYVRAGSIRHQDNLGNAGVTKAGQVQVMSAGTGVTHAEYGDESEETRLYQIWLTPQATGLPPRWAAAKFPTEAVTAAEGLRLLVSGLKEDAGKGALEIYQDARVWGGRLAAGQTLTQDFGPRAYVLVSAGEVALAGEAVPLRQGDAVLLQNEPAPVLTAGAEVELVVLELPA